MRPSIPFAFVTTLSIRVAAFSKLSTWSLRSLSTPMLLRILPLTAQFHLLFDLQNCHTLHLPELNSIFHFYARFYNCIISCCIFDSLFNSLQLHNMFVSSAKLLTIPSTFSSESLGYILLTVVPALDATISCNHYVFCFFLLP